MSGKTRTMTLAFKVFQNHFKVNLHFFLLLKHLAGGTLLICQLDVALNGVTLYDSQRSALSKRNLDADTISYCGLTRFV